MAVNNIQNSKEIQQTLPESEVQKAARADAFANVMKTVQSRSGSSREVRISNAVAEASQKYNLPPALILGVIKQESGFKPCAESHCGAQGLMQLMPETAKDLGVRNSFDIEQNIDGGCKYLRQMLDQFGGDVKLALAAYNAGPGNVRKYDGIPPFEETQNYVKSILSHTQSFGGKSIESIIPTLAVDSITMRSPMSGAIDRDMMIPMLTSSLISTTPIKTPKLDYKVEEPPPPPPPYAVRV